jgi:hypothetical protein
MRETDRSGRASAAGRPAQTRGHSERASPAIANPIRPRYTNMTAATLAEMVKPVIDGEATSRRTHRAVRGDWGGRVRTVQPRVLGDPAWCNTVCATAGRNP